MDKNRILDLFSYSDENFLYEQYYIEENFFKKLGIAANIITQLLGGNVQNNTIQQKIKNDPQKIVKVINSLPDTSQKEKALNILKDIEKNVDKIGSQTLSQIEYIKQIGLKNKIYSENIEYLLLDDKNDKLYFVKGDSITKEMNVVTGADKGDVIEVDDFIDWLEKNKKSDLISAVASSGEEGLKNKVAELETEFFQYVGKKITPSGFYKLNANPEYKSILGNIAWGKELIKAQPESYGNIGVIQPKRIADDKGQYWLIHGTQNPTRVASFNSNVERNMSMGCVNVNRDDNIFLVDIVKNHPDMALISLSEDGKSLIDVSEGLKYVFGKEPKTPTAPPTQPSNIPSNTPIKKEAPQLINFKIYELIREVNIQQNIGTDNIENGGSQTNKNINFNPTQAKSDSRKKVDIYFDAKYNYLKNTDEELLKSLKTLPATIKNIYVGELRRHSKDIADLLKGAKLSTLSENFFKRLKDKFFGKKIQQQQQQIQQQEIQITNNLTSFANKVLAMNQPLSKEQKEKIIEKASEIKDSIIQKMDNFVDSTTK